MIDTIRTASDVCGLIGGAAFAACFALSLLARALS